MFGPSGRSPLVSRRAQTQAHVRRFALRSPWAWAPLLSLILACDRAGDEGGEDGNERSTGGSNQNDEGEKSGSDSGAASVEAETDTETTGSSTEDPEAGPRARGIAVVGLEVNQGVAIRVAEAGAPIKLEDRNTRLVHGRPALVRALHRLADGWQERRLEARLTLHYADGETETLRHERKISRDPDPTKSGGVFKWALSAEQVQPGMAYSVGLFELDDAAGADFDELSTRLPAEGSLELGVPDTPMRLEIVVVPIRYDGSTPDFTEENLAALKDATYELNPVQEVLLSVREEPLELDSGGLPACLRELAILRGDDDPEPQVYYLGLMDGPPSGLANLTGPTKPAAAWRAGCAMMGTDGGGWAGVRAQIAVHEVGHNQGSLHNPGCGAAGATTDYPYLSVSGRSELGVWGYGVLSGDNYHPGSHYDIMSYCRPHWVGDYTWEKWARTVETLTGWTERAPSAASTQELLWTIHYEGRDYSWVAPGQLHAGLRNDGTPNVMFYGHEGQRWSQPSFGFDLSEGHGYVAPLPAAVELLDSIVIESSTGRRYISAPTKLRR